MAAAMAMPSDMWMSSGGGLGILGAPRAAYQWGAPPGGGYRGGGGSGGGNGSVVDKVLPDMMHLIDSHWYVVLAAGDRDTVAMRLT